MQIDYPAWKQQWSELTRFEKLSAIGSVASILGIGVVGVYQLLVTWIPPVFDSTPQLRAESPAARDGNSPQTTATPSGQATVTKDHPASSQIVIPIREASQHELVAYLDSLPPLHRAVVEREYVGRLVSWQGEFVDVKAEKSGFLVFVEDPISIHSLTSLQVGKEFQFLVETLREGDRVAYEGTILRFYGRVPTIAVTKLGHLREQGKYQHRPHAGKEALLP